MNEINVIENELVPVYETGTGEKVVYGSELHDVLRVKAPYREWSQRRLKDCDALENEDFQGVEISTPSGQTRKDHIIKLDTAKEMAMLERNDKGKQVRKYFVEIEKKYRQGNLTPEQIVANALIVAQNIISQKDKQIEEMTPKAEYFDELVDRNLLTNFRETSKELGVKESFFIEWLVGNKYIYRDGKNKLRPYATAMEKGLFEIKEYSSRYSNHAGTQTLITPKGRETFRLLVKK